MKLSIAWVLIFCCSTLVWSQHLPPVVNFPPDSYGAGNQNWGVSQGPNQHIYIANNDGLLEYDGAYWELHPSPNQSIIRSVAAYEDHIYTGSYMDFGRWDHKPNGNLQYTSLLETLEIEPIEDEQFWTILRKEKWILFQSFDRIIIYDRVQEKVSSTILAETSINKVFLVGNAIFFQELNLGLFQIENGVKSLFSDATIFKEDIIINMFPDAEGFTLVSQNSGILQLQNQQITSAQGEANVLLKKLAIYSAIQLKSNAIAIGTISSGIYVVTPSGELKYHMEKKTGLTDNTVLSLWQDQAQNIWVGLNDGMDCINVDSRFFFYSDPQGKLGTTYVSVIHEGNLYLGTNQGLFYKSINTAEEFIKIPNTEGQVWDLKRINNQLFMCHYLGTFLVSGDTVIQVASEQGTWTIREVPNQPDLLLQGNYSGLHILSRKNGQWQLQNKIKGFDISSKHFEWATPNRIIVNHEYKGVYVINVTKDYQQITDYSRNNSVEKSQNSAIVKWNNKVLYGSNQGVFSYVAESNTFIKDTTLSTLISSDSYLSGKMIVAPEDQLWIFTKNYLNTIRKENLVEGYTLSSTYFPSYHRSSLKGYENISYLGADEYLIGTGEGYLVFHQGKEVTLPKEIIISKVVSEDLLGNEKWVDLSQNTKFNWDQNNITFYYGIPEFRKFIDVEYQHLLKEGENSQVSDWGLNTQKRFDNLDPGKYSFEVRAKIDGKENITPVIYNFEIMAPWYKRREAIIIYIILSVLLITLINYLYKLYYRKQQKRALESSNKELKLKELAAKEEIMRLKNDSLNQDIELKNRELAIATMNMLNKNNVLQTIKTAILKVENQQAIKPVLKLIDNSLDSQEEWKFFEEAFNQADKNFFKKVKEKHPDLTANDLRLCVYLRLNLSSKEIAPLLNISHRSVEIKRYRLRKKINLDKGENLNEYFMGI